MAQITDWYENRHLLEPEQTYKLYDESIVKLDRRVPGDGTQWYAADWWNGSWSYMDRVIEPGDIVSAAQVEPAQ